MNTNTRELILPKWKHIVFNHSDIRVHSRSFVVETEEENRK